MRSGVSLTKKIFLSSNELDGIALSICDTKSIISHLELTKNYMVFYVGFGEYGKIKILTKAFNDKNKHNLKIKMEAVSDTNPYIPHMNKIILEVIENNNVVKISPKILNIFLNFISSFQIDIKERNKYYRQEVKNSYDLIHSTLATAGFPLPYERKIFLTNSAIKKLRSAWKKYSDDTFEEEKDIQGTYQYLAKNNFQKSQNVSTVFAHYHNGLNHFGHPEFECKALQKHQQFSKQVREDTRKEMEDIKRIGSYFETSYIIPIFLMMFLYKCVTTLRQNARLQALQQRAEEVERQQLQEAYLLLQSMTQQRPSPSPVVTNSNRQAQQDIRDFLTMSESKFEENTDNTARRSIVRRR